MNSDERSDTLTNLPTRWRTNHIVVNSVVQKDLETEHWQYGCYEERFITNSNVLGDGLSLKQTSIRGQCR